MPRAIVVASGTVDVQVSTACTLVGYYVNAAGAAGVTLRNGTTATDPIVHVSTFAAAGVANVALPAVDCPAGLFLDRTSGTTDLIVYIL